MPEFCSINRNISHYIYGIILHYIDRIPLQKGNFICICSHIAELKAFQLSCLCNNLQMHVFLVT